MLDRTVVTVFAVLLGAACDSAAPAESARNFERVEFRFEILEGLGDGWVEPLSVTEVQLDLEGAATAADTLSLAPGSSYTGFVRLADASGIGATDRVRGDPEEWQVFYDLEGLGGVEFEVNDTETDYRHDSPDPDMPVGLAYALETGDDTQGVSGSIRVRIVGFQPGIKTGVNASGGTVVADFRLPVEVVALPRPSSLFRPITRAEVTIDPGGGADPITIVAENPDGLHLGAVGQVDSLLLATDHVYPGQIRTFRDVVLEDVTPAIREEAVFHRFEYEIFSQIPSTTLTLEPDGRGLPFGQTFRFDIPSGLRANGEASIRLRQYDPNLGNVKGDEAAVVGTIVEFTVPFRYE